jgi:nitrate/nitrite-specific signal transduction histidine kinase
MESNFTKSMTLRYLFALGVLALIAIISDYVLQKKINTELSRGAVVNISGQQRMLSQRIALQATQLAHSRSPGERAELRRELAEAITLMESSLEGLIRGDSTLNLPAHSSSAIQAIYFSPPHSLREKVQKFLVESKDLEQAPESAFEQDNPHLQHVASAATALLYSLDALVNQYQKEGDDGIARLQRLERTVMVITIFVLLLMALFIFRPMVKRLQAYLIARQQVENEREKLIVELREALANVKTLRGLVPICASCKKIRDDRGYWNEVEDYVAKHSEADFTHGFCPDCKKTFDEE